MPNVVHLPLLDSIQIATPCSARWEDMVGDDRVRHCAQCDLDVHDLSAMQRDEAEKVLEGLARGRVCARFYRRADGTILTADCPVGVARVRRAARRALVRVAAMIGLVSAAGVAAAKLNADSWGEKMRLRALKPFSTVCEWVAPSAPPVVIRGPRLMGDICVPAPKAPVPSPTPAKGGGA